MGHDKLRENVKLGNAADVLKGVREAWRRNDDIYGAAALAMDVLRWKLPGILSADTGLAADLRHFLVDVAGESQSVIDELLEIASIRPEYWIGKALFPLSVSGESIGSVRLFEVGATSSKLYKPNHTRFCDAVDAAFRLALHLAGEDCLTESVLWNIRPDVWDNPRISGGSVGMAAFVACLSHLRRWPVPACIAFSGTLKRGARVFEAPKSETRDRKEIGAKRLPYVQELLWPEGGSVENEGALCDPMQVVRKVFGETRLKQLERPDSASPRAEVPAPAAIAEIKDRTLTILYAHKAPLLAPILERAVTSGWWEGGQFQVEQVGEVLLALLQGGALRESMGLLGRNPMIAWKPSARRVAAAHLALAGALGGLDSGSRSRAAHLISVAEDAVAQAVDAFRALAARSPKCTLEVLSQIEEQRGSGAAPLLTGTLLAANLSNTQSDTASAGDIGLLMRTAWIARSAGPPFSQIADEVFACRDDIDKLLWLRAMTEVLLRVLAASAARLRRGPEDEALLERASRGPTLGDLLDFAMRLCDKAAPPVLRSIACSLSREALVIPFNETLHSFEPRQRALRSTRERSASQAIERVAPALITSLERWIQGAFKLTMVPADESLSTTVRLVSPSLDESLDLAGHVIAIGSGSTPRFGFYCGILRGRICYLTFDSFELLDEERQAPSSGEVTDGNAPRCDEASHLSAAAPTAPEGAREPRPKTAVDRKTSINRLINALPSPLGLSFSGAVAASTVRLRAAAIDISVETLLRLSTFAAQVRIGSPTMWLGSSAWPDPMTKRDLLAAARAALEAEPADPALGELSRTLDPSGPLEQLIDHLERLERGPGPIGSAEACVGALVSLLEELLERWRWTGFQLVDQHGPLHGSSRRRNEAAEPQRVWLQRGGGRLDLWPFAFVSGKKGWSRLFLCARAAGENGSPLPKRKGTFYRISGGGQFETCAVSWSEADDLASTDISVFDSSSTS